MPPNFDPVDEKKKAESCKKCDDPWLPEELRGALIFFICGALLASMVGAGCSYYQYTDAVVRLRRLDICASGVDEACK